MELLPKELREQLPPLRAQGGNDNPTVYAKFFTPDAGWTWYVTEGQEEQCGNDFLFFGFVVGVCAEWGPFSLAELLSVSGVFNLPVERDLYFTPGPFSEVVPAYDKERLLF